MKKQKIKLSDKLELTYEDITVTLQFSDLLCGVGRHSIVRKGKYRRLTGLKLLKG